MGAPHRYYVNGKRVPGVTTVTDNLGWSKRALMRWANRVGLAGSELEDARKGPADIGTIAHALIEAEITGEDLDLSNVEDDVRKQVETILSRWVAWKDANVDEVLHSECELVHEEMEYGGRLDMVFRHKAGGIWLLDVKTGGIYPEALVQVAGYAFMVEDTLGRPVDTLALLRIPRDADEFDAAARTLVCMERPWDRKGVEARTFRMCRELHRHHQQLRREV